MLNVLLVVVVVDCVCCCPSLKFQRTEQYRFLWLLQWQNIVGLYAQLSPNLFITSIFLSLLVFRVGHEKKQSMELKLFCKTLASSITRSAKASGVAKESIRDMCSSLMRKPNGLRFSHMRVDLALSLSCSPHADCSQWRRAFLFHGNL